MNDAEKRAKKAAKEIKEARFVVKWSPVFWFVGLVLLGFTLDRCIEKPGVISYLRLLLPAGYFMRLGGWVHQSKAKLRGEDETGAVDFLTELPGTVLIFAGVYLPDVYRRSYGPAFGMFGAATLFALACFLIPIVLGSLLLRQNHKNGLNKRARLAALRSAANNPVPPTEPAP